MTTILIVDDHPMVVLYTRREVQSLRPDAVVASATCVSEAERFVANEPPEFVLLDLVLPDSEGLEGLVRLRRLSPNAAIGILTGDTNCSVMRDCFTQGARGFFSKRTGADDFVVALRKFFENGFYYPPELTRFKELDPTRCSYRRLTARELDVLRVLAIGKANKQLAPLLGISENTFKTYLRIIFEKLGARTRLEAVRRGAELGLVSRKLY